MRAIVVPDITDDDGTSSPHAQARHSRNAVNVKSARKMLDKWLVMIDDRIDFISAYCDRWCERCAFTTRCSTFLAEAAIGMCGDAHEGLEVALGTPHPVGREQSSRAVPDWLADLENIEMTPDQQPAFDRQERERKTRIAGTSIMNIARTYSMLSHRWYMTRGEHLMTRADPVLTEALEIAGRDALLISAKLYRALSGRDRLSDDEDDHPIQNDWNGSAKVALISLERSEAAWRTIAIAVTDTLPTAFADQLRNLRREVEAAFPHARSFIRPGFDEPDR
jgi:hypothetical protein